LPLIEALLILLVASRLAGEIAERYGQPAMLGEIAAGVLLGPSVLNYLQLTPDIKTIAEIGVLLLVFHAGLEMDLGALRKAFQGKGIWVGVMGFVTPLAMGSLLGVAFGFDVTRTIFIGLCIAITALPVSVRLLMDLGKLQSEVGEKIIAAAVMNDVASLLVLGVILDLQTGTGGWQRFLAVTGLAIAKAVGFMVAVVAVARLFKYSTGRIPLSKQAFGHLLNWIKGKEALFALVLLFVLLFASLSDVIGLHFIVGAFFGAMILGHESIGRANYEAVKKIASSITMGFLGPIFFASLGLEFQAASLANWPLVVGILGTAFAGKLLGGFWGGRLGGLSKAQSWALGCGLNGRGIMELVIANIALSKQFITQELFSILVLMGTTTTLATPFLLRRAFEAVEGQSQDSANTEREDQSSADGLLDPCLRTSPVNDAPVANPDHKTTVENQAITFPARDLTLNDTDTEGDPLTVSAVIATANTHGTLRMADGMITYTPDRGFIGTAQFGYSVTDGQGGSALGTVYMEVIARNMRRYWLGAAGYEADA
jgi:Kef-type K+ transport system membrane component KefB